LNLVGLPISDLLGPDWARLLLQADSLGLHVEIHREAGDLEHADGTARGRIVFASNWLRDQR
jgi:hypothetical protein